MDESFEELIKQALYWMSLGRKNRPGESAWRYRQIQFHWPDHFTAQMKGDAFKASYLASAKAYGGFSNHYDSLFNALHAASLIPAVNPEPGILQKLYRILSKDWQAVKEYGKAMEASLKAEEESRKAEDRKYLRNILSSRVSILLRTGSESEALDLADQVLSECAAEEDSKSAVSLTDILCRFYLSLSGGQDRAAKWIERLASLKDSRILLYRAVLAECRGNSSEALDHYARFASALAASAGIPDIFESAGKIDFRVHKSFFLGYAGLLADTEPAKASILLRAWTAILEKQAGDNRDLIIRNLYLADHLPDLVRACDILFKTDPEASWSVLQIMKNAYLVLETEFNGEGKYTHKTSDIFKNDLTADTFKDAEFLSYSYSHFEAPNRSLPGLQSRMRPDDLILDYHQTGSELRVFAVSASDFRTFRIPSDRTATERSADRISALMENALSPMIGLNPTRNALHRIREAGGDCGRLCLPDLQDSDVRNLFVVPCHSLNRMPLHLFRSGPVTYLFNSLLYPPEEQPRREGIAVLHHSGLPHSVREVFFLSDSCAAIPVPNPETLKSVLPGIGRLHISGHFVFDRKTSKSYFDFGSWRLPLSALDTMDFRGVEVVLMACESGRLGEYMHEHENFDACRYFLRQGASCVLAASHAITEATALAFTRALYAPGHRGQSLEEDYQNALRKNPSFAAISPFLLRR